MSVEEKEKFLVSNLKRLSKLALVYSGNLESTYLLKKAIDVLGNYNVLAVVMSSDLFFEEDFDYAIDLATSFHVQVLGLEMHELKNPRVAANTPKSWYYSRKLAYQVVKDNINAHDYPVIGDSFLMDDKEDFKPGLKARDEEGIHSFLEEAKLYKKEVEDLAILNGLQEWNRNSNGNVASRFPYGTHLSQRKVKKIFAGENFLKSLGFSLVRMRLHGNLVRIEIKKTDFEKFVSMGEVINDFFQQLGFEYVTLDIKGYKAGRMNDVLNEEEKNKAFK